MPCRSRTLRITVSARALGSFAESAQRHNLCLWYTSLVSKEASLPALVGALRGAHVRERRIIEMVHGQKRSRIVAWSFLNDKGRQDWRKARWGAGVPTSG